MDPMGNGGLMVINLYTSVKKQNINFNKSKIVTIFAYKKTKLHP